MKRALWSHQQLVLEARGGEMRLDRCWGQRTGKKQEGQSELGVPGPTFPAYGCSIPLQAHQSLTTFVISGKLRSGVSISMVKALGFEEASSFLTKVSGVKHPAPGRARWLGEPCAGR